MTERLSPYAVPLNRSEFKDRFMGYKKGLKERKRLYELTSLEDTYIARVRYYQALRLIFFVCVEMKDLVHIGCQLGNMFSYEYKCGPNEFNEEVHESLIRTVIINLRKLGELCLKLDRIDECIGICNLILDICGNVHKKYFGARHTLLTRTYGLLIDCCLVRGDTDGAISLYKHLATFSQFYRLLEVFKRRISHRRNANDGWKDFRWDNVTDRTDLREKKSNSSSTYSKYVEKTVTQYLHSKVFKEISEEEDEKVMAIIKSRTSWNEDDLHPSAFDLCKFLVVNVDSLVNERFSYLLNSLENCEKARIPSLGIKIMGNYDNEVITAPKLFYIDFFTTPRKKKKKKKKKRKVEEEDDIELPLRNKRMERRKKKKKKSKKKKKKIIEQDNNNNKSNTVHSPTSSRKKSSRGSWSDIACMDMVL